MTNKIPPFKPEPGGNRIPLPGGQVRDTTYANLDFLRRELDRLVSIVDSFQVELESELIKTSMLIDRDDKRFMDAHNAEWPEGLGDTSDYVSYRYYKALRLRNTTSASYIRKRYEEAARDVTGNSALDILTLIDLTRSEALLMKEFLDTHVDTLNDASEQRIIETFQDWVQPAIVHTQELRSYFTTGSQNKEIVPEREILQTSPTTAKHGQAIFKVKLNSQNDKIRKDIDYLKKNFSEFGPVFYNRFLGPSLDFRKKVGLNVTTDTNTPSLSKEIVSASKALDSKLNEAIADQARRRTLYNRKLRELRGSMQERDKYRNLISDLSNRGNPVPHGGSKVFVSNPETAEEVVHWNNEEAYGADLSGATPSLNVIQVIEGNIRGSHGALDSLDEDHHPQYLLRSGGKITGDINFVDGVTIDGIVPSEHRHTGSDGSPQIHGEDIIGGTLKDDVVDPSALPQRPFNLQVENHTETVVPPGITLIDTTISWEGNAANTFEIQITRIYG